MNNIIHYRLLGYSATILIHVSNLMYMRYTVRANNVSGDTLGDKGIKTFKSMEYRYFTTWNVGLQIAYSAYALFCETLIIMNKGKNNYRLPKIISDSREIFFGGLVWPSSWLVSLFFWTLYSYDRSLIYPVFLDKIIMSLSNHVIHSAILLFVIWEVKFRPRRRPRTHSRNLMQLTLHMVVYGCVLYYTYFEHGIWLYPIFELLYGTIHFVLLHVYIGLLCLFVYYSQWWLNDIIHGTRGKVDKKK